VLSVSARSKEDDMHQAVEAIVYPDGRVEVREAVRATTPRRAILTILDEAPGGVQNATERPVPSVREALRAAGLLVEFSPAPAAMQPLSETERAALAARIGPGTPLSQIINEDRDERF
jgi:hypothetical protein